MPRPSPSTIHHTPRAALVNTTPPRARAGPTIVPEIATPRVVPVCRPAEASEVATPAIERGMPETAVLVIGGMRGAREMANSTGIAGAAGRGGGGAGPDDGPPATAHAGPAARP